jgi:hypothetical protein
MAERILRASKGARSALRLMTSRGKVLTWVSMGFSIVGMQQNTTYSVHDTLNTP